jgi:hypothetical protein
MRSSSFGSGVRMRGADQHRAGLGGNDEIGPVIRGYLGTLQHDQELASLALIRANHAGVGDHPLPEVIDQATGRTGRHVVHQQAAEVAQLDPGGDVGRGVVRGQDRQLLLGRPVDDHVAGLAAEGSEVPVAPLHEAHGGKVVDKGLHGALVVDLLLNAPDGCVGRITVGFEFEHAGAGLMTGQFVCVDQRHPRRERRQTQAMTR